MGDLVVASPAISSAALAALDVPHVVASPQQAEIPVNSYTEWDPLEEVIVGRLEGATFPSNHVTVTSNLPPLTAKVYRRAAGFRYPKWMVRLAQRELDEFIHLLESEGIRVRRPDVVDFARQYHSPHWSARGFSPPARVTFS